MSRNPLDVPPLPGQTLEKGWRLQEEEGHRCGPTWPWFLLALAILVLMTPFLVPAYFWDVWMARR